MILSKKYSVFLFLFFYTFLFLFFNSELSPLYPFNSWPDVNVYFTTGRAFINDLLIYRDIFDHKGPLICFIYGFGYLISNSTFLGVFVIEVLLFSIAIYYIYLIIRFFTSNYIALSLTTIFPIFYLFYSSQGGSAEDFVLIAEIISLYYFISYFRADSMDHSFKYMFIHGFLIACTFFIKLNLILFWFFPLLFIFLILVYNKLYASAIRNFIYLLVGILSITIPIILYFVINDAFDNFIYAYIDFNLLYASQSDTTFFERLVVNLRNLKFRDFLFIFFCLFGFIVFFQCKLLKKKTYVLILFLTFISQLLFIYSGAHLYLYYLLCPLVFVILGLVSLAVFLEQVTFFNKLKILPLVFSLVCLFIGTKRTNFYGYKLESLITRNFPVSTISIFSDEIQKEDNPSLLCVGLDETLAIFNICDIVPNVKFFYLPNITIEQYPDICDAQIDYILNKEVDFLILDERFRYYDYYIDAVNKTYKIRSTCVGKLGYYIHLYEKK